MIYWMSKETAEVCDRHHINVYGFDTSRQVEPGYVIIEISVGVGVVTIGIRIDCWQTLPDRQIDLQFRTGIMDAANAWSPTQAEYDDWPEPDSAQEDFNAAGNILREFAEDLAKLTEEGK